MRVNARFEGAAAQQVDFLATTMDVSVSEVLRLGVQALYEKARGKQPGLRAFAKHVGRYDTGQTDGSVRYKAIVAEAIERKYPRSAPMSDIVSR